MSAGHCGTFFSGGSSIVRHCSLIVFLEGHLVHLLWRFLQRDTDFSVGIDCDRLFVIVHHTNNRYLPWTIYYRAHLVMSQPVSVKNTLHSTDIDCSSFLNSQISPNPLPVFHRHTFTRSAIYRVFHHDASSGKPWIVLDETKKNPPGVGSGEPFRSYKTNLCSFFRLLKTNKKSFHEMVPRSTVTGLGYFKFLEPWHSLKIIGSRRKAARC